MARRDASPTQSPTRTRALPRSFSRSFSQLWRPAVAGIAAAIAGLGAAELAAALFAPAASPILAVGALIIDIVPGWFKDVVIALFGTGDKAVLIVSVGLLVVVLAAFAGGLELRRPLFGRILIVAFGAVALFAALSRANAAPFDALPSVVAMIVSVILLAFLVNKLREVSPATASVNELDRRRFLAYTGASAGLGILAYIGGQLLSAGSRAADSARALFTLPTPAVTAAAVTAAAIPAGASFDIAGLSPVITPNVDFYRIDTALQVPRIDPREWTLKITGMVENEVDISFAELLALPLEESTTTLACVSNYVGGDLIGNATWLGYPIRELLARAKPHSDADMVLSRSQDGWTASTPLAVLTDDRNAILAVGMNGEALPLEHGYPVRMVVPGLYGYVSATKWVVEMKLTRFDQEVAYWTTRGWGDHGPIKLSSRIDVPGSNAKAANGSVTVAGVAWSQHVGVSAVQVQVDDGDWNEATLADAISADTWRQWMWEWAAPEGQHTLRVRATDANGLVQTSVARDVLPDGATGLHEIEVSVS